MEEINCFMRVDKKTTVAEMEEFGVSNLLFVFYDAARLLHFFIMDNNKAFTVRHSSLMSAGWSKGITNNLLFIFEKFKIKELEDCDRWAPIESRFEILDL